MREKDEGFDGGGEEPSRAKFEARDGAVCLVCLGVPLGQFVQAGVELD